MAVGPGFGPGGSRFRFTFSRPQAGEHVKKPVAIETDDGLHSAIDAGIGAAPDARLILALRTLELERPAHGFEIQLLSPIRNPASLFKGNAVSPTWEIRYVTG